MSWIFFIYYIKFSSLFPLNESNSFSFSTASFVINNWSINNNYDPNLRTQKKTFLDKNWIFFSFIHKFYTSWPCLSFSELFFFSLSHFFRLSLDGEIFFFFRFVFFFFISEAFTTRNQYCAFNFKVLHFFPVHILFSHSGAMIKRTADPDTDADQTQLSENLLFW